MKQVTDTTKWRGTSRKTTPVDPRRVSHYQENTRLTVDGELRRRRGMARTSLAKQSTAILNIMPAFGNMITQGDAGTVDGGTTPTAQWGDVQLRAPTGTFYLSTAPATYTISATATTSFAEGVIIFASLTTFEASISVVGGGVGKPAAITGSTQTMSSTGSWVFYAAEYRNGQVGPWALLTAGAASSNNAMVLDSTGYAIHVDSNGIVIAGGFAR